jgi:GTPase
MIFRLNEGFGHATYRIGVEDSGVVLGISQAEIYETLSVLFYMARN